MAFERSLRIEPGERPDLQDPCEYLQDFRPADSDEVIFVLFGEAFLTEPNSREHYSAQATSVFPREYFGYLSCGRPLL